MARRRHGTGVPISLFSFQDIMAAVTGIMILVTLLLALDPPADEILQPSPRTPAAPPPGSVEAAMSAAAAREVVERLRSTLERRLAAPTVTERTLEDLEREVSAMRALSADAAPRRDRAVAARDRARTELESARRAESEARQAAAAQADAWRSAQLRSRVRFHPGERFPKSPLFVEVSGSGCTVGEFAADGTVAAIGRSDECTFESLASMLRDRGPDAFQAVFVVRQDGLAPFESLRGEFHDRGWEVGWQLWDAGEGGFFEPPPAAEATR